MIFRNKIKEETERFTEIFLEYIRTHSIRFEYDDYIPALRTHLVMMKYDLKKVNKFIRNELLPNLLKEVKNEKSRHLSALQDDDK